MSERCNHAKSRAWEIASRFIDASAGSPSIFMNEIECNEIAMRYKSIVFSLYFCPIDPSALPAFQLLDIDMWPGNRSSTAAADWMLYTDIDTTINHPPTLIPRLQCLSSS
jgi:hypothetical protein